MRCLLCAHYTGHFLAVTPWCFLLHNKPHLCFVEFTLGSIFFYLMLLSLLTFVVDWIINHNFLPFASNCNSFPLTLHLAMWLVLANGKLAHSTQGGALNMPEQLSDHFCIPAICIRGTFSGEPMMQGKWETSGTTPQIYILKQRHPSQPRVYEIK